MPLSEDQLKLICVAAGLFLFVLLFVLFLVWIYLQGSEKSGLPGNDGLRALLCQSVLPHHDVDKTSVSVPTKN